MTRITQTARDEWEAFAEATLTGDESARQMGRQLAAQTPPIALAAKARHRKPRRRFRPRLPLWAGALLVTLQAKHEMETASAAQGGTL